MEKKTPAPRSGRAIAAQDGDQFCHVLPRMVACSVQRLQRGPGNRWLAGWSARVLRLNETGAETHQGEDDEKLRFHNRPYHPAIALPGQVPESGGFGEGNDGSWIQRKFSSPLRNFLRAGQIIHTLIGLRHPVHHHRAHPFHDVTRSKLDGTE